MIWRVVFGPMRGLLVRAADIDTAVEVARLGLGLPPGTRPISVLSQLLDT